MDTERNSAVRTLATAADYKAKVFKDKNLLLFELFRAQFEAGGKIVLDALRFENCQIEGPAVLLPLNACTFDDCNFGVAHGDMRNLILHPGSPDRITGAIAMAGCEFRSVDFFSIGFTGGKDFLDSLLEVETRVIER